MNCDLSIDNAFQILFGDLARSCNAIWKCRTVHHCALDSVIGRIAGDDTIHLILQIIYDMAVIGRGRIPAYIGTRRYQWYVRILKYLQTYMMILHPYGDRP